MSAPRLTFFVELTTEPLVDLFARPGVKDFLAAGRHGVAMGLLDLTAARAAIVRELEGRGVPVTAWLLLDVADGYWLNADNAGRARARYREMVDWAACEGLRLHRVGLDIECPAGDGNLLRQGLASGLWTLVRRRRTVAEVGAAERAYAELVAEIRAGGRTVETYHFPQLLDERRAGTTLLRRTLGLVDVPADAEVYMLYASYLGRAGARAYFDEAQCIAVGVTGGGVLADDPQEIARQLTWEHFEQDLLAAAAATDAVYVFSLEGCVWRDMLHPLARIDWARASTDVSPEALQRARRRRIWARRVLYAEPLLDLILPSKRGASGEGG